MCLNVNGLKAIYKSNLPFKFLPVAVDAFWVIPWAWQSLIAIGNAVAESLEPLLQQHLLRRQLRWVSRELEALDSQCNDRRAAREILDVDCCFYSRNQELSVRHHFPVHRDNCH